MSTCFFIGHREAPDSLLPTLIDEVERHITEYDVKSFVVGHYGQFDALAGQAVMEAKKRHPEVSLIMLLPYQNSGRPTILPEGFDNTFYPFGMERIPPRAAIPKANQYMVDHSDFLIAYGRPRLRRPQAKKQGISHPYSYSFAYPRQGIKKRHRFVLPMALPRQMAGLYSVIWSRGGGPD